MVSVWNVVYDFPKHRILPDTVEQCPKPYSLVRSVAKYIGQSKVLQVMFADIQAFPAFGIGGIFFFGGGGVVRGFSSMNLLQ